MTNSLHINFIKALQAMSVWYNNFQSYTASTDKLFGFVVSVTRSSLSIGNNLFITTVIAFVWSESCLVGPMLQCTLYKW